jgi:hypothetical protein
MRVVLFEAEGMKVQVVKRHRQAGRSRQKTARWRRGGRAGVPEVSVDRRIG